MILCLHRLHVAVVDTPVSFLNQFTVFLVVKNTFS